MLLDIKLIYKHIFYLLHIFILRLFIMQFQKYRMLLTLLNQFNQRALNHNLYLNILIFSLFLSYIMDYILIIFLLLLNLSFSWIYLHSFQLHCFIRIYQLIIDKSIYYLSLPILVILKPLKLQWYNLIQLSHLFLFLI